MNCFYQQALGRAQICLTVQQILGNSIEGNTITLFGFQAERAFEYYEGSCWRL